MCCSVYCFELCCSMYCFCRLCCSIYCLFINVYYTTATGCLPNCSYIYRIVSYHIISYHIISYHIISYHIISYHIIYRIVSYRIVSYHIISYHIISYHIISYHIISYHTKNRFQCVNKQNPAFTFHCTWVSGTPLTCPQLHIWFTSPGVL